MSKKSLKVKRQLIELSPAEKKKRGYSRNTRVYKEEGKRVTSRTRIYTRSQRDKIASTLPPKPRSPAQIASQRKAVVASQRVAREARSIKRSLALDWIARKPPKTALENRRVYFRDQIEAANKLPPRSDARTEIINELFDMTDPQDWNWLRNLLGSGEIDNG